VPFLYVVKSLLSLKLRNIQNKSNVAHNEFTIFLVKSWR